MTTVSILTPVYGVEKYIEQSARSLFEQTYEHIEYIFVNDCTPDHSIDILKNIMEDYPDRKKQVRIIEHPQNRGVGAARQTALMAATGDYIMFADSDDFMPSTAVEKLMTQAINYAAKENGTLPDLVDGAYAEWKDGKTGEPQMPHKEDGKKYLKILICQNIIYNRLWGRIYKRSVVTQHKIFFHEGVNYAEDILWNAQFHYFTKNTTIDDVVYYYRTDNVNSYNHDISEKNLLSYFKSTSLLIQFFKGQGAFRTYRRALDIALVNAYRWARNTGVSLKKVDENIGYRPKTLLIKLVIRLLKLGVPVEKVNYIYLSYRKLYIHLI